MKKFTDAYNGLKKALKHKAVVIQVVLGLCAVIGGIIIRLDAYEWMVFAICIGVVIALEIMNTAIEFLCNYINKDYDEKIGDIKDISSAAVLVSAIMAFVVMIVVVLRRLL